MLHRRNHFVLGGTCRPLPSTGEIGPIVGTRARSQCLRKRSRFPPPLPKLNPMTASHCTDGPLRCQFPSVVFHLVRANGIPTIEPFAGHSRLIVKREHTHPHSAKNLRGYDADTARTLCAFPWRIPHVFPGLRSNNPPRILSRLDTDGLGTRVTLGMRRGGEAYRGVKKTPKRCPSCQYPTTESRDIAMSRNAARAQMSELCGCSLRRCATWRITREGLRGIFPEQKGEEESNGRRVTSVLREIIS